MADRQFLERLTKKLADDGKLIEAGFIGLRLAAIPLNAPAAQLREMRLAFMAGAQHTFSSMLTMLDPGVEETEADFTRMDLVHRELEAFGKELEQWAPAAKRAPVPPAAQSAESRAAHEFASLAPHERLGDRPVEAEYAEKMRAVAGLIDEFFNGEAKGAARAVAFVLMVFPFGDRSGRCNYMSNGVDRRDMAVLMKEMAARFEGQPDVSGRA